MSHDLRIGGTPPEVGTKVSVLTHYGQQTGSVTSRLDRNGGRWLVYVIPDERPSGMAPQALWEITSWDVPWCLFDASAPVATTVETSVVTSISDAGLPPEKDEPAEGSAPLPSEPLDINEILKILAEGEVGKSVLLARLGIEAGGWPHILQLMKDSGKVETIGVKRATKYRLLA